MNTIRIGRTMDPKIYLIGILMLVSLQAVADPEVEPNDNLGFANLIAADDSREGRLNDPEDVDWYKFNVTPGSAIVLDLSLTQSKNLNFPYNLSAWKLFIFDPDGKLLDEYKVDLAQDAIIVINAYQGGTFLIAVDNDGFSSDAEYSLAFSETEITEPPYSDFSGIWQTSIGYFISAHQSADNLIFALLYTGIDHWDVHQGTVIGDTVTTSTYYGSVAAELEITMTSPNTLEATQLSCQPVEDCQLSNGTKFTATRIIQ